MLKRLGVALWLAALSPLTQAATVKVSTSFAIIGAPRYPPDFRHFDYVFPAAPKGGQVTMATLGTFDNFNRFALRGAAAIRTEQLYDSLFTTSDDEIGSYYPLVGQSVRYADDYRWAEVTLNPAARFHNHQPVTAEDVAFTFQKFMTEGVPQFRLFYKDVKVIALSRSVVRYEFKQPSKDGLLGLFTLPIMPKSFWSRHKLSDPLSFPPPAGGPYRITAWKSGQYVTYSRVKDYWAAALPVNVGQFNFDSLRYDYYLDDNVALEAFMAGAYDVRVESSPKNWATYYRGGNIARGFIKLKTMEDHIPVDTRWLAFNLQRPLFADRRVRQALTLALDFEWINRALFYQGYQRASTYFQNTDYAASGRPDAAELALLTPLKQHIPAEAFGPAWRPPVSDGSGYDRRNRLQALELLRQAGWELNQRRLVNSKTGQRFSFELLMPSGGNNQYVLPFQHSLQRLGIDLRIREVDNSQFTNRLRSRDFDMLPTQYRAVPWPGTDLPISWGTAYLNSTHNTPGVSNPAVDALLEQIIQHQDDEKALVPLGRALDRVLTWNAYMIPLWYSSQTRVAWWNKFAMPATRPAYTLGFNGWWLDTTQAATLPAERR